MSSSHAITIRDVARAAAVTRGVRAGLVNVSLGIVESRNIFESSWRLKSFFEGPRKNYDSARDYAGSVLYVCKDDPSREVYENFGIKTEEWVMKVVELKNAGKIVTRSVAYDGVRPILPLRQRARWGFIKEKMDAREGMWKTGDSKRLLAGVSEEIILDSASANDQAYNDIFQLPMKYKEGQVTRTTPNDDCCIVAISYRHYGEPRMTREDFSSLAEALRSHFSIVRLWVDACIESGSDVMKWVHIGLTPYLCMPVAILHNAAYKEGYDRVWITLERRLALKGSDIICVGSELGIEQGYGVSEYDNVKNVCSDLLGGRISRAGLSVDDDYDDLVQWSRSVLMLPPSAVPIDEETEGTLADYYSSSLAEKILTSMELSRVNGGAERHWIERATEQEKSCWTSSTLFCIEGGGLIGAEDCGLLPDGVLDNLVVLDVAAGTPGKEYEVPCWYATAEGTFLVYKIRLQVSQCGLKKEVVCIRKLPEGMFRPFEDLLAEAMLVGATSVVVRSGKSNLHEMWTTTPAKYNIIKGSEANWH